MTHPIHYNYHMNLSALILGQIVNPDYFDSTTKILLSMSFQENKNDNLYLLYGCFPRGIAYNPYQFYQIIVWSIIIGAVLQNFTLPHGFECHLETETLCEIKVNAYYALVQSSNLFYALIMNDYLIVPFGNLFSTQTLTGLFIGSRLLDIDSSYIYQATPTKVNVYTINLNSLVFLKQITYSSLTLNTNINVSDIRIRSNTLYLLEHLGITTNILSINCLDCLVHTSSNNSLPSTLYYRFYKFASTFVFFRDMHFLECPGFPCLSLENSTSSSSPMIGANAFSYILLDGFNLVMRNPTGTLNSYIPITGVSEIAGTQMMVALKSSFGIRLIRIGNECSDTISTFSYQNQCQCFHYNQSDQGLSCIKLFISASFPFYYFIIIAVAFVLLIVGIVCLYFRCKGDKRVNKIYVYDPTDIVSFDTA